MSGMYEPDEEKDIDVDEDYDEGILLESEDQEDDE